MKKLFNFLLVVIISLVLGYFFQPTIDKMLIKNASPELQTKIKARQMAVNAVISEELDKPTEE